MNGIPLFGFYYGAQARIKSAHFGAVAAIVHRAPTPALVLASVQEQPAARVAAALLYSIQIAHC
jgi:hypothetical protein